MWYHIQIAILVYVENIFFLAKFARSLNATQWSAVQFNQACRILIRIMLCRMNLHATKSSEMKDWLPSVFVLFSLYTNQNEWNWVLSLGAIIKQC